LGTTERQSSCFGTLTPQQTHSEGIETDIRTEKAERMRTNTASPRGAKVEMSELTSDRTTTVEADSRYKKKPGRLFNTDGVRSSSEKYVRFSKKKKTLF
jgi:hypothetical protein